MSFVRVICLSQENTAYLYKILTNYIINFQPILLSPHFSLENVETVFSKMSVSLLLSRLCIKFDTSQINQVIVLAVQLYKNLPLIASIDIQTGVRDLWKAIFYTSSKSELSNHLLNFLALPVINENNYVIQAARNWTDPFYFLNFDGYQISILNYDSSLWHDTILHLIQLVKHNNPETRSLSILRLYKVHLFNGLDKDEQKLFAEVLWSQVDSEYGLPNNFNRLYKFTLLYIPEIVSEITQEKIKNYLLSADFPQLATSTSFSGVDETYLRNLLGATCSIYDIKDEQKLVNWNIDEIEQIVEKIFKGIKTQEEVIKTWYHRGIELSNNSLANFIKILIEILNLVIFPRIKNSRDETKAKVKKLILIIESINSTWVLTLLPGILIIEPNRNNEIAKKLKKGLFSSKIDESKYALGGIFYWLIYGEINLLSPPPDLFGNLVNWIYSLRQPGLNYALIYLIRIVINFPNILQEKHFEYIFLSLEYLLEETRLPNSWFELDIQDPRSCILYIERPEYRQLSSELAYYLYQFLEKAGQPIPDILNSWKELGLQDELLEVRNIWQ